MNREDVIRMAHEAAPDLTWYAAVCDPTQVSADEVGFLSRFAALVAAAEREACAAICDHVYANTHLDGGREAQACATAIRTRSNQHT